MMARRAARWSLLLVLLLATTAARAEHVAEGRRGMVASAAPLASGVGVATLSRGGNAIDAAVASAFALAVVLPQAGNLGGGGFALARDGRDGSIRAMDFRETAPERANSGSFLDARGHAIPEMSTVGISAAGVPGTVAGLEELHRRRGRLPWRELLEPAISLAEDGFVIDGTLARLLDEEKGLLARFDETRAIFFRAGRPLVEGERLVQKDLARTLRAIRDEGAAGFYRGRVAELIARSSHRHGGMIELEDLRRYRAVERPALVNRWRDLTIYSMPPPSSGGVTLAEILNIIEPYDLRALGPNGATYLSVLAEASRRAFYDRARHLGDPDYVAGMPVARLMSKDYAATLRTGISPGHATEQAAIPDVMAEPGETTHLSIADAQGNLVALTTTINGWFGSGLVVDGAGFLLNNEMDDFATEPGAPNIYGLTGGSENAVEPGKRMLSSMAPTIVMRADRPYMVLGARGGPRIITTVIQVLLDVYVHGMDVGTAVAFPRIHHQGSPDLLYHDARGLSPDTMDELCRMGYHLEPRERMSGCQAIVIDGDGFEGAYDPRDGGAAIGY